MDETRKPPRTIGLAEATLINLNGTIGAGIFALPALLYAGAGSLAPLAILAFAVLIGFTVAIAAKLSTLFEQSGGGQLYVHYTFGEAAGFQVGWLTLCANMSARAANFHVMVAYLAALFPFFDGPVARPLTMLAFIAFFTLLAIIGTRRAISAMWVGTVFKLAPLVIVCLTGLLMNGLPSEARFPEFSQVEATALLMAYAFSGAAVAVISAGETKNPQKSLGRSIYLNLAIIAVFYAFIQLAYEAIGPDATNADSPLAAAGAVVFGEAGVILISVAAIFSIGTGQLNYFLVMPRILYGMGRRGTLPRFFAYLSPGFLTPSKAILIYALIVTALAVSGGFATLATLTVAAEIVIALMVIAALYKVWRNNDGGIAKTMGPGWLATGVIATGFTIWLGLQVPLIAAVSILGMIAVGFLLYWLARGNSREGEPIRIVSK